MKKLFALAFALAALGGCGAAPPDANTQAQMATTDKKSILGRSMDKGEGVATDSNISQINAALGMAKGEDGKPPATIEDAKHALKDYPAEMWMDKATGKSLRYDPATGTVSR